MAVYYVDVNCKADGNSGLNENEPVKNYRFIDLKPGDKVLFKRGSFIRDRLWNINGEEGNPVVYGAYGEGDKPVFCTSVNLSRENDWKEVKKGIWETTAEIPAIACNFIFDGGKAFGALRWNCEELTQQGDFYDNCFGKYSFADGHKIYLKSEVNPAQYYSEIECATNFHRVMAESGHDIVFEDLCFINNGIHAIAGEDGGKNITVRNCDFKHIGGCVWDREQKIRFGNAVEFWDICENVTVENCLFDNIYDSAVTHQGSDKCLPAVNTHFDNNVFIKCGMGAYEGRDVLPVNSSFNGNLCIDAGEGFSKLGEELPRYSEIWPQPMGHHIFLWRIEKATEGGSLEIKNNIFDNSPIGAAIYSIISKEAEAQITLSGNTYYTENKELLNRYGGQNYADFSEYEKSGTEDNCRYLKIDRAKILLERGAK